MASIPGGGANGTDSRISAPGTDSRTSAPGENSHAMVHSAPDHETCNKITRIMRQPAAASDVEGVFILQHSHGDVPAPGKLLLQVADFLQGGVPPVTEK
jgi:hypothetical protein